MQTEQSKHEALNTFAGYSARQVQFAIRLGLLPTPEKLRKILTRKSTGPKINVSVENKNRLLIRKLSLA